MSNLARQLERKRVHETQVQHEERIQQSIKRKFRFSKGEKFLYFSTIVGLFIATYFIISTFASIYVANSEIHSLEKSINIQNSSNEALRLQVTELSAPDRILQIAMEELGMTLDDKNVKVVKN